MLTRAARRRHALHHSTQIAEHIQLPWLCPALARPSRTPTQKRSIVSRHQVPRLKINGGEAIRSRRLASAATLPDDFDYHDDFLPFTKAEDEIVDLQRRSQTVRSVPTLDLSKILMIKTSELDIPQRLNVHKPYGFEVRGPTNEVEATFDACLQIRRWDRALAILKQLCIMNHNHPAKLLQLHNRALASMVDDMIANRNPQNEKRIHDWIEVDMKAAGINPDAYTFALKVKVALETLVGSRRDRTVRRYWDWAKQFNLESEIVSLRGVLNEKDLGKISQIYPLQFEGFLNEEAAGTRPEETTHLDGDPPKHEFEIRETEQKGLGLTSLRQSLSLFSGKSFNDLNEEKFDLDQQTSTASAESRQRRLERDAVTSAVSRWKIEHEKLAKMGASGNLAHGKIGALLWQWHEILEKKIVQEMELVQQAENKKKRTEQEKLRCEYGPFLAQLEPKKLAAVTTIGMMQIMNKVGASKQTKVVKLVTELGRLIEAERDAEYLRPKAYLSRKTTGKNHANSHSYTPAPGINSQPGESTLESLNHNQFSADMNKLIWTAGTRAKLGAILCQLMFDTAKITISKEDQVSGKKVSIAQPVFLQQTVYQKGKRVGVVSLQEDFVDILVAQPPGDMVAKQLPMICRPRPWKGFYDGGFLESDQPFLRVKQSDVLQKEYGVAAAGRGDLDQIFAGVDVLSRTGWRINEKVFEVMVQAWNSGEAIANLPPIAKVFTKPERPAETASSKEKFDWYAKMRTIDNEKNGLHSNRCSQNFQMEIAKSYLKETFYLPHNVDFRGRAYPIPPYLNQMGADNCRGLLLFANGRALGPDGLRWLKIHLSNVYGYDKASFSDRAQFPLDHLDDIYDSVRNPLDGKKWWLTAEDPWQCLACCFELTRALESEDPTQYISHLPIHQDGSCNGLQHYAALGGDVAGARQVNLEPGDKPADIYTGVAEIVKEEIKRDAAKGHELAKLLDGRITRKIVKQTVMTNVYGVTFLGAIRQVRKQVDDIMPDIGEIQKSGTCSTYIARKIFSALAAMFTGAHKIQYWLGDCANRISGSLSPAQLSEIAEKEWGPPAETAEPNRFLKKSTTSPTKSRRVKVGIDPAAFRSSVIWTTPLKLPVVQPYRVNKGATIQTSLQKIKLAEPSVADAVNKRKQLQAFPPNFIHSLDATHMILSALKADELGLTFAAVHDSFWTHAADVNILNRLLRDAFIRMHSEDIVKRLAAEFKLRYQGHIYLAHIRKDNPLGQALTKHRQMLAVNGPKTGAGAKTLASRRQDELLQEIKRANLLKSYDLKEREEGEKMITAASLFEKLGGEKYLCSRDSLGETAIGAVPKKVDPKSIEDALNADEVADDVNIAGSLGLDADPADDDTMEHPEDEEAKYVVKRNAMGQETMQQSKTAIRANNNQLWLWLPLTFRAIPEKGDFDVKRLRDSQYFFS